MDKELEIKLNRCTLILYESELMRMLSSHPDIFRKATGRGKGAQRVNSTLRRQAQGFGPYDLFRELTATYPDEMALQWVKGMDPADMREAVTMLIEARRESRGKGIPYVHFEGGGGYI